MARQAANTTNTSDWCVCATVFITPWGEEKEVEEEEEEEEEVWYSGPPLQESSNTVEVK